MSCPNASKAKAVWNDTYGCDVWRTLSSEARGCTAHTGNEQLTTACAGYQRFAVRPPWSRRMSIASTRARSPSPGHTSMLVPPLHGYVGIIVNTRRRMSVITDLCCRSTVPLFACVIVVLQSVMQESWVTARHKVMPVKSLREAASDLIGLYTCTLEHTAHHRL